MLLLSSLFSHEEMERLSNLLSHKDSSLLLHSFTVSTFTYRGQRRLESITWKVPEISHLHIVSCTSF